MLKQWGAILIHWLIGMWDTLVYRAWISTAIFATVALLFFYSNQTREILWGVAETMNMAGGHQLSPGFRWSGVEAYAALWGSSLLLAVVLASIVRIMAAPASNGQTAQPVTDPDPARGTARFCAALVLVATLLAIHYPFLSENLRSTGNALAGFALMSGAMLVLLAAITLPLALRARGARRSSLVAGVAVAAAIAWLVVFMFRQSSGGSDGAMTLSSVTPLLALLLWVGLPGRAGKRSLPAKWVLFGLTAALTAMMIVRWDPNVVWIVGSPPVALLFLAWLACALGCCQLFFRWLCRRFALRTDLMAIAVVVLVVVMVVRRHERIGREELPTVDQQETAAGQGTVPAQQAAVSVPQGPAVKPPPGAQFAIHADGGGLRAALFTAVVLAAADDMTCGAFGSHVFAASGVSGGSLGIATWAVMRQEFRWKEEAAGRVPWGDCERRRDANGQPPGSTVVGVAFPLEAMVSSTLVLDHLSTAIAALLKSDLLSPWGDATRGQALLDSWQGAAIAVLAADEKNPPWRQGFSATLRGVTAGLDRPPLLMFTATGVETGGRVVFSNAKWWPVDKTNSRSIGVAALNSARFPGISPAGAVFHEGKWIRVVDGGIFDNSGAATLREMLGDAKKQEEKAETAKAEAADKDKVAGLGKEPDKDLDTVMVPGNLVVVRINGNSPEDERCPLFFQLLDQKHMLSDDIWLPPQWKDVRKAKPQSADDKTLLAFDGWSAASSFIASRPAHADELVRSLGKAQMGGLVKEVYAPPITLDPRVGFDDACVQKLQEPDDAAHQTSEEDKARQAACLLKNRQTCYASLAQRAAPLGWYFSWSAADPIQKIARVSAVGLAARMAQN